MTVKLSDKQISNYKNDGVILIKEVFLPWIEKLKTGFHKVLNNPSSYGRDNISKQQEGRFFEDYCNWRRIEEFKDFIFNSPAAEIVAQSTQSNQIQVFHEHIFLKEPGTKKETPWHQDLPYYCVDGNDTGSFWIPLDNASKAKSMIKNLIDNFDTYIDPHDPTNNCLDVAIITVPEKRSQKTKDKLKTVAGRVLNK